MADEPRERDARTELGSAEQSPSRGGAGTGPGSPHLIDSPPFLSWRAIYAIVLGALALEAVLSAILTALYS